MKKNSKNDKQKSLILEAFNFKDNKIKDEFNSSIKNFKVKITIKNISLVCLGSLLTALSFFYFINPALLYTNGLSSFAQLIAKAIFFKYSVAQPTYYNQMTALYFYPIFFAMNVPIIIWGIFKIGLRFSFYTTLYIGLNIAATTFFSLTPGLDSLKIFNLTFHTAPKDYNSDLAAIFIFATLGGLIYGAGLGILFKSGGSSGGMDFISTYISIKRKYSISKIIRNVNSLVVVTAVLLDGLLLKKKSVVYIFFEDPHFLATLLYINIGSFAMNRVYPKYMMMTVFIISNETEKIRTLIYSNNYLRGGNIWGVTGLYSKQDKKMIMTTMSLLEYNFFKYKFQQIDPCLFMVALPTRSMVGGKGKPPTMNSEVNLEKLNDFLHENQENEKK